MRAELNKLIRDFEELYNGDNWVAVGIADVLSRLDFQNATRRKLAERNTAFQIVQHCRAWRTFLIKRLSGDVDFNLLANDPMDWRKDELVSHTDFNTVIDDFHDGQKQIVALLNQHTDEILEGIVAKRTYDFRHLINGVLHHDYYHFGQVAILM